MYPNLSYLFNDFFNSPLDNWASVFKTYGMSLVFTFGICSIILKSELRRRESIGLINPFICSKYTKWAENIFLIAISAIIGYKIIHIAQNLSIFKTYSREMILSSDGNVIGALSFILCSIGILYYSHEDVEKEKTSFYTLSVHLTIFIVIFALIGNKLFGIFEVNFEEKTLTQIFNESGTNFLGGLFGGMLGGYIFCKLHKIPYHNLLDSIAPVMMLGYAIGRLGCHISGDGCWGIDNNLPKPNWFFLPDWLWSYNYPHNVVDRGTNMVNTIGKYSKVLETPVFPTSLYEAIFGFTMFLILWQMRKKVTKHYVLFICFFLSMGIERFFIEFIRINSKYSFAGLYLSQAQYISLFLIIVSISFLFYRKLRSKYQPISLTK
jgi:phosphatidylglycerol---prolipoprotein diacylglyceryl transferase